MAAPDGSSDTAELALGGSEGRAAGTVAEARGVAVGVVPGEHAAGDGGPYGAAGRGDGEGQEADSLAALMERLRALPRVAPPTRPALSQLRWF